LARVAGPARSSAFDQIIRDRRSAVILDTEGLSYAEIASQLCLNVGTVRGPIHRGREVEDNFERRWLIEDWGFP
jgi:DNA-directed RNA polymerase specialized sigma24 family protein